MVHAYKNKEELCTHIRRKRIMVHTYKKKGRMVHTHIRRKGRMMHTHKKKRKNGAHI